MCGLCMPLVLYGEFNCDIYDCICSLDGFILCEEAVCSCFLPAKTLVPLTRPVFPTVFHRSPALLLECGNGATQPGLWYPLEPLDLSMSRGFGWFFCRHTYYYGFATNGDIFHDVASSRGHVLLASRSLGSFPLGRFVAHREFPLGPFFDARVKFVPR